MIVHYKVQSILQPNTFLVFQYVITKMQQHLDYQPERQRINSVTMLCKSLNVASTIIIVILLVSSLQTSSTQGEGIHLLLQACST